MTLQADAPAFRAAMCLDEETTCLHGAAGDAATRWATEGHRHLVLLLSLFAGDEGVAGLAPSLRRDSERIIALFQETEGLRSRATEAGRERERLQQEVNQLRETLHRMKQEREDIADELTVATNAVVSHLRGLRGSSLRRPAYPA